MKKTFENQVAIVTGAGTGIGFEIARQLAQNSAAVVLNDLDAQRAVSAVQHIAEAGGEALAVAGDTSDLGVLQLLVDKAVEHFGRLDIAVANAGVTIFGDFFEFSAEDFQRLLAVNLQGSFFLAQFAARQMRRQGAGGRIVFMSSVTGTVGCRNLSAYGVTKAGLQMLAKSLVPELSPFGITVNAIAPGATLTERTQHDEPGYADTWSHLNPTGRVSTPADIASAALFLASPFSSQITGQTLIVDGGWTSVSPGGG